MSRFTFIVPPLTGHINPTLGVGKLLSERGHQVTWISANDEMGGIIPDGCRLVVIPNLSSDLEKIEQDKMVQQARTEQVYGIDSLMFLYENALLPFNRYILERLPQILEDNPTDLIINDLQVFAGAVAAIKKGIPYVTSVTTPAAIKQNDLLPQIYDWEEQRVIAFQKEAGIEGNERLDCSKTASLVYTSEQFFGEHSLPDYFRFVGPSINQSRDHIPFDWGKLKAMGERPKVLLSIGTTFDHQISRGKFYDKAAEALGDMDITVIAVTDPDNFTKNIPQNFIVRKRVPQLDLLPYMNVVICHAGHNTVIESLYNGVPLVVLPIAYDQSYVAGRVTACNAGIRLNFNRFTPPALREAVGRLLNEDIYRENARKIGGSFQEAGGINKAVEILESLVV